MADILPFLREAVFDAEATTTMSEAFEMACKALPAGRDSEQLREGLAKRIIQHAQYGERNPVRLCAAALAAVGIAESGAA